MGFCFGKIGKFPSWGCAINGTVTVGFDKEATEAPKAADLVIKKSINGAEAVEVTEADADIVLGADKKSVTVTVPAVEATDVEQSVVYSVSYKGGEEKAAAAFKVEAALTSVDSVTVTNATTLAVKLVAAKTGLTAADFKVSVNGTDVTPTAVASDATGASYTLTIATLSNTQGKVSVNGKEGSFDFKVPSITSVTAPNNKTVVVNFDEELKSAGVDAANFDVKKIVGGASLTVNTAVLSTDKKSVILSVNTAMVDSPNGYVVQVPNGQATKLADVAGNAVAANSEFIFSGTGTADTAGPALQLATYAPTNNTFELTFDKTVNLSDANVNEAGITIKGAGEGQSFTFAETDFYGAANGTKLSLVLSQTAATSVEGFTGPLTVSLAEGTFKDTLGNTSAVTSDFALNLNTTPAVTAATYNEQTDRLVLTFDQAVKYDTIDATKIGFVLNGGVVDYLDNTTKVISTANGNTIELEAAGLTEVATASSATLTLGAGAFENVSGLENVAKSGVALTYQDDTSKPTITSASYNDGTKELSLTFSEKVDVSTLTAGEITISDGTTTLTLDADSAVKTTVDGDTIVITLDASNDGNTTGNDQATILTLDKTKLKLVLAAGAFTDMAANGNLAVATTASETAVVVPVTVSDLTRPTFAAANATVSTQVTVTFNEKVNKADAENVANYTINSDLVTLAVQSAQLLSDGKTVVLTTAPQSGITYTLEVKDVRDLAGNAIAADSTDTFVGVSSATDGIAPAFTGYDYTDVDGSKSITAGDKIELSLDEVLASPISSITAADFEVNGTAITTEFGTNPSIAYADAKDKLVITLGVNPTLAFGNAVDVAATNVSVQ